MSKKAEKKYTYNFSYYWGIQFANEEDYEKDLKGIRYFKPKTKRQLKVEIEGVRIYLNLKFVTTEGKMKSVFPTSVRVWSSDAAEYEEHLALSKQKKPDDLIEDNKIKIIKNENGPQIASPMPVPTETRLKNGKRKKTFEPENYEPTIEKTTKTKAEKSNAKNILFQLNYEMKDPADTDVTNNPACKSPDNDAPGEYIEPQIPIDQTGNNLDEFFNKFQLENVQKYNDDFFGGGRIVENLLDSEKKFFEGI